MSDLIDDPREGENAPEFSVSELSGAIKKLIEGTFNHVRIRAEVGRVSFPRSGHVYLDLKDDKSVISGVIWKGVAARLPMRPEEGMEVVATGRLTTFGGQSKYQIVIEDMKPAGVGALMAMLEKRRVALGAEGLFDDSRKKPLPFVPSVIGVVTSPSGAVIRDILHRLRDRFPSKVLIWPVAVQGEKCAPEVARGIEGFNALTPGGALPRPDLIIVARNQAHTRHRIHPVAQSIRGKRLSPRGETEVIQGFDLPPIVLIFWCQFKHVCYPSEIGWQSA